MNVEQGTARPSDLAWFKSSYSSGQGGACIEVALDWSKSSYSSGEGGACVEMAVSWRKSSHSGDDGADCVEVANCPGTVHVRDSKDVDGPQLALSAGAWSAFLTRAANEPLT